MVDVFFSPRWFYGIDAIFESIAILATALLAFYAHELYKFTKKATHRYFSLSFFVLSLSFLVKVITNLLLYFPELRERTIGFFIIKYYLLEQTHFIYAVGNLGFRFLMLLGLLGIFWIIGKSHEKNKLAILLYFILTISLVSILSASLIGIIFPLYILFHITAALFLAYISYFYFTNYLKKKKRATFYIFFSFLLIFLSQLAFIFVLLNLIIYVIAELLQLLGYFLLLYGYYLLVRRR